MKYIILLIKLNINLCELTKIKISIPVKLNGTLDIHNPKSGYYNDICYIVTSDCGTDISLKDRRNEFVNNNLTLCEENCDLIGYDYEKEKVKCSCDVKTIIPENLIDSAMLLSRGINFYFPMIITGIVVLISTLMIKDRKK